MGKWRDVGQRVQTKSPKVAKFWGFNVQRDDYNTRLHVSRLLS